MRPRAAPAAKARRLVAQHHRCVGSGIRSRSRPLLSQGTASISRALVAVCGRSVRLWRETCNAGPRYPVVGGAIGGVRGGPGKVPSLDRRRRQPLGERGRVHGLLATYRVKPPVNAPPASPASPAAMMLRTLRSATGALCGAVVLGASRSRAHFSLRVPCEAVSCTAAAASAPAASSGAPAMASAMRRRRASIRANRARDRASLRPSGS